MKILTVIGARPQFIKAAAVSSEIQNHSDLSEVIVHTGQHYDKNMSDIFFNELDLPNPDYHLGIGSRRHGEQTGLMLEEIEKVLLNENPDCLLIYGDTNSTLAAALAASKLHIPIAHVEAGLRSFNKNMPEEINRVLSDHLSTILFPPTSIAMNNLLNEGIEKEKIHLVGDVMFDIALYYSEKTPVISYKPKSYYLATIHRAENTNNKIYLRNIMRSLISLAQECTVILPLHPRTERALKNCGLYECVKKSLVCIEPQSFLDMMALVRHAKMIFTDSGGLQKEAFFHQVPCITLRDETEWVETVEMGWNTLYSPSHQHNFSDIISNDYTKNRISHISPYGDGQASKKIINIIKNQIVS